MNFRQFRTGSAPDGINSFGSQADHPSPKSQKVRIVEVKERFEEIPEGTDDFGWGVLWEDKDCGERIIVAKFRYQVDAEEYLRNHKTVNKTIVELIN